MVAAYRAPSLETLIVRCGAGVFVTVDYTLSHDDALHTAWDRHLEPALGVASGEVVHFDCLSANGPRITPETRSADLPEQEFIGHHLTGPVSVAGAQPGDVLQIDILDVNTDEWGYTVIRSGDRGVGLLPEEFPDPVLYHWRLSDQVATFEHGIEIPIAPFPGVVGVAPSSEDVLSTTPPRAVGGNLDIKHLTAGSTIYLPVAVEDALFSIGDGHAVQGDGEVCVSAIETPVDVTVRLTLREDLSLSQPRFRTSGPFAPVGGSSTGPAQAVCGIADSLMEATKEATRGMIEYLHTHHGLSREEAYILCSVAGDLKINEVVDAPNWVVSMYVAESLLPGDTTQGS